MIGRFCPFCGELAGRGHLDVSYLSPLAHTIRDHFPGVDISRDFTICLTCVEGTYALHKARRQFNKNKSRQAANRRGP